MQKRLDHDKPASFGSTEWMTEMRPRATAAATWAPFSQSITFILFSFQASLHRDEHQEQSDRDIPSLHHQFAIVDLPSRRYITSSSRLAGLESQETKKSLRKQVVNRKSGPETPNIDRLSIGTDRLNIVLQDTVSTGRSLPSRVEKR
jgi:hypothetical protein